MGIGLLGQKVGMTQIFDEQGDVVPVTVLKLGPCTVLQLRKQQPDGYEAVQVGFLDKKRPQPGQPRKRQSQASRSERGHVAKLDSKRNKRRQAAGVEIPPKPNCEPKKYIREFRVPVDGFEVGQELNLDVFDKVKAVDVTGTSKGRGFAGAMKRHNFHGLRATHGTKKVHRHTGSLGQCQFPGRILKGKKMPGHYGNARKTQRNLKVVRLDKENNLMLVYGAVPGPNGGFVQVYPTNMMK